jgi:hypothetical protein
MQPRSGLPPPASFGLRFWPEATGPDTYEWRGRVTQLPGQDTFYFRDLEALAGFLRARLEEERVVSRGS